MTKRIVTHEANERLSSLDFLRGLIMVALMIGETGFFQNYSVHFQILLLKRFPYNSNILNGMV